MGKLDLSFDRQVVAPTLAATVIIVKEPRDGTSAFRVLCVKRSAGSAFLGGAVVFPGGKVSKEDLEMAQGDDDRAWRLAACRETLEEAAIALFASKNVNHADAVRLQKALADGTTYGGLLVAEGAKADTHALVPLSRWVTPVSEGRRFDTMFYLVRAPEGQLGQNDAWETDESFWATPRDVLARFDAGDVFLVPPTHRTLEQLAAFDSIDALFASAPSLAMSLQPICPELVKQAARSELAETIALTLPGDPEHSVREPRISGLSRYVLRGERWLPEEAPSVQR